MQLDTAASTYANELEIYKQRCGYYEQHIEELKNSYEKTLKELHYQYLEIKERYELLVYKRFARSAEQLLADTKQPLLFTEELRQPETKEEHQPQEELQSVQGFTRKKAAGRKPLSPNLERRETIIDIPESEKTCACGAQLTRIGEETSEKLHITPPEIYVEKTIRPKYACGCCEGTEDEQRKVVRIAPVEPAMIPRGIASPSLLSTIFTQKFQMHLPYYRQEEQFSGIGAVISRQDMSNWQQAVYKRLEPLLDLEEVEVKSGPVIQMDETVVQVMGEEGREDTQQSRMWVARGGPPGRTVLLYKYHPTRGAYHAKEFLEGYSGYLQTDGYEGYDAAIKHMSGIIHVGCFAHVRRKFFEAAKVNKGSPSAQEGIKHIRTLYDIERELRGQLQKNDIDNEKFVSERKALAEPVLQQFKGWLEKRKEEVPPSLVLGKAIGYTLRQWDKLTGYLESPYLTPDNNACENAIRPFVLGRKNWLFCQSPGGAESSCGMYSLIQTARENGLNAFKYLKAVFEKAPLASSPDDWKKLLPWNIFTP